MRTTLSALAELLHQRARQREDASWSAWMRKYQADIPY